MCMTDDYFEKRTKLKRVSTHFVRDCGSAVTLQESKHIIL